MCGPTNYNDAKRKAAQNKFAETFEAEFLEIMRKHCSLLQPGDDSPVFEKDATTSVSAPPKPRRSGGKKNRRATWIQ